MEEESRLTRFQHGVFQLVEELQRYNPTDSRQEVEQTVLTAAWELLDHIYNEEGGGDEGWFEWFPWNPDEFRDVIIFRLWLELVPNRRIVFDHERGPVATVDTEHDIYMCQRAVDFQPLEIFLEAMDPEPNRDQYWENRTKYLEGRELRDASEPDAPVTFVDWHGARGVTESVPTYVGLKPFVMPWPFGLKTPTWYLEPEDVDWFEKTFFARVHFTKGREFMEPGRVQIRPLVSDLDSDLDSDIDSDVDYDEEMDVYSAAEDAFDMYKWKAFLFLHRLRDLLSTPLSLGALRLHYIREIFWSIHTENDVELATELRFAIGKACSRTEPNPWPFRQSDLLHRVEMITDLPDPSRELPSWD